MERIELPSWAQFKSVCIEQKNLNCQYVDRDVAYDIFGPDGGMLLWCYTVPKDDGVDQVDFETNYKSSFNRSVIPLTYDGLQQSTCIPAVDPKYMCFCQGVSKQVSTIDNIVQWQISFPYVQLMGMTIQATGFDRHDKLLFEVGYYLPSGWVQVSGYGIDVPLINDPFFFHQDACRVSMPIPQGLYFRVVYQFKDPQSTKTPDVGILYHLQRAYAA